MLEQPLGHVFQADAREALPPSHKREYLEWIASAKRAATRDGRIARAVAQLASGQSLNARYR